MFTTNEIAHVREVTDSGLVLDDGRQNSSQLRNLGWDLLEIWECELKDLSSLESLIRAFLK